MKDAFSYLNGLVLFCIRAFHLFLNIRRLVAGTGANLILLFERR
jgi:hypothetical protein